MDYSIRVFSLNRLSGKVVRQNLFKALINYHPNRTKNTLFVADRGLVALTEIMNQLEKYFDENPLNEEEQNQDPELFQELILRSRISDHDFYKGCDLYDIYIPFQPTGVEDIRIIIKPN